MNHADVIQAAVIQAMRNPLVIFHADCMDGFGAAWAAWTHFREHAEYLPAAHGRFEVTALTEQVLGRDVLILDFSYPRHVLEQLNCVARSLVVLDHHKTAQADLKGFDGALFDMERSGAGIAWDVIRNIPEEAGTRPPLIDYIEDRDLWRFALPHSRAINAWIGCVDFTFEAFQDLAGALNSRPAEIRLMGEAVLRKVDRYVAEMAKQARLVEFEWHCPLTGGRRVECVPAVNAPYINTSELVGHLAEQPGMPFAIGWFRDSEGMFRYSLRSRGYLDVSAVAKAFGGGGHHNAAGFSSRELLV